jgi:carboxyl-terminal processing protease
LLFVKITSALVLSGLLASLHTDKGADPQRLLRLEQLSWSVLELTKNYVDPSRFEPRVMLKESLRAVENLIPDLLVDEAKLPESLTLRIGTKSWTGDTRRVESIWEMYMVLRQGLGFVGRNLPKGVEAAEVELAAVNGMLQTLDPHSVMFSPKAHEEMRMSTQGAFGGLGIVISQRDGWLTVISPIPGTPASRAGVRARDQIVQINEETTENMTLEEAVNLLRGAPGSDVTVHIRRKGTKGSLQKTLTREIIKVRSVTSHDLGEGIGYVRIKSFRETTTDDAVAALAELRQAGAKKGLILDLRDNPGGLLEQAVAISDLFLSKGVIVTTVGFAGQHRERRYAHASGSLSDLPLVVLISGGSASASEIVAGAVRNHKRGLLLGNPSFGKGSVQTIIPYRPRRSKSDGSALKLTIAQYLTPGDISIQGTGIAPDIDLHSVYIDDGEIYLTQREGTKESDLHHALSHERAKEQQTRRTLSILDTDEVIDRDEQTRRENSGVFQADLTVRMAKTLLLRAGDANADTFFAGAGKALDELELTEDNRLVKAFEAEGIDWQPVANKDELSHAVVEANWPKNFAAGNSYELPIVVRNTSKVAMHRVVVRSKASLDLFDHREWVFGRIEAGQELKRVLKVELPKGLHARSEWLRFEAQGSGRLKAPDAKMLLIESSPHPSLSYTMTIDDGNDGMASVGETVTLHFAITASDAEAKEIHLSLRSKSGSAMKMVKARAERDLLSVGAVWNTSLSLKVRRVQKPLELTLNLGMRKEGIWYSERLTLPRAETALSNKPCAGPKVVVSGAARLLSFARLDGRVLGQLKAGEALPCLGQVDGFYRLRLPRQGVAYLSKTEGALGEGSAPSLGYARTPPSIVLTKPMLTEVTGTRLLFGARAKDDKPLHNVVVYRGRKKVLFAAGGPLEVGVESSIELEPGQNLITIHAREGEQYGSSTSFWVLRRDGWDPDKKSAR